MGTNKTPIPPRYIVKVLAPLGGEEDIWTGPNLDIAIAAAKRQHVRSHARVWIYDAHVQVVVYRIDRKSAYVQRPTGGWANRAGGGR